MFGRSSFEIHRLIVGNNLDRPAWHELIMLLCVVKIISMSVEVVEIPHSLLPIFSFSFRIGFEIFHISAEESDKRIGRAPDIRRLYGSLWHFRHQVTFWGFKAIAAIGSCA